MASRMKSPEIRFNDFTDDWEEISFKKLFVSLFNNSLSREKLNYYSGQAKNIHYGDILVKYRSIVDIQKEVIPYITEDKFVKKNRKSKLKSGDIIFADAAEDNAVGKCVEITNVDNENILAGLHTIAVRPQKSFASKYLGYYLNSKSYHNQLLKLMQGTKVLSISKNSVRDTIIMYPKSRLEQQKISNFLSEVDSLKKYHQTQLKKLKNLKKAMHTKMFPQEGETKPEIRFKSFDGEWSKKKLKQITTYDSSSLSVNDALIEGKFELYDANKIIGYTNKKPQTAEYISIVKDGSGVGRVRLLPRNSCFIATMGAIKSTEVDVYFLFCLLANKDFTQHITGATIPHIYYSVYGEDVYLIPEKKEQEQIGTYFRNLDNLIENHQIQIKKLNNIKKACLNKLFVA